MNVENVKMIFKIKNVREFEMKKKFPELVSLWRGSLWSLWAFLNFFFCTFNSYIYFFIIIYKNWLKINELPAENILYF